MIVNTAMNRQETRCGFETSGRISFSILKKPDMTFIPIGLKEENRRNV